MGFRMYIHSTYTILIGLEQASPKLYGYVDGENLPSVIYLSELFPSNLFEDDGFSYEIMCYCPEYGPFELTAEQYNKFIDLYIKDLKEFHDFDADYGFGARFIEYALKLKEVPGNKILEWG